MPMSIGWQTWTLFLVSMTALCLTPGPAVLLVVSQGLTRGALASLWSNLGILAGNTTYFVLSATGLGAIIATSYRLFTVIRWAGAAYLIALGVATFTGRSKVLAVGPASPERGAGRMFANGFVLQAGNPNSLVFFTAFVPQYIDPAGNVPMQVAVLAVTTVVVEFFVLAGYGVLAGRASGFAARPEFATVTNRIAGSLLIGAGASTLALRRT